MHEPYGPPEPVGTPGRREPFTTPAAFAPQRATEQAIYTTLHEIQNEQGRHNERIDTLLRATHALTERVEALTTRMSHVDRSIQEFNPKIDKMDDTYKGARGAFWAFSVSLGLLTAVIIGAATLIYWSNATRIDKLIKVLESPGIEKLLKRDGR
ncbi:MAG: hypothetical protein PGN25_18020 [Methylorubrum populi]